MKKSKFIRNFLIVFGVYFMLMVISKNNISSNINDITNSIGTNNHSISNSLNVTNVMSTITSNFISAVGPTVNLVSGVDLIPNSTNQTDMKNNTKNLQKAIDEMSESGGGTIYLPAGTFYFAQGGIAAHGGEDYAIRCRNNVHLKGAGTNENSSNVTILKPYYNNSKADGGMDMFYFNNYADTGYNDVGAVTTSTKRDVTYTDMNNKKVTLKNQTVYLINADFSDFIVDGDSSRGGIAKCGGSYKTDGKGFMINLFKDCDWNNIVVKNTDATGFGIDCPINSTMTNCKAINCGKAALAKDGGASGFGIGTGYSPEESLLITNCVAINNKKFGFFFEHQSRFSGSHYPATSSKGFVVSNSIAGGNMYDFGGLKAQDVTFENVKSISGQTSYSDSSFKKVTTSSGTCGYSVITYSGATSIKLNSNTEKVYFSMYSTDNYIINSNIFNNVSDVNTNEAEIKWAVNKGIIPLATSTKFNPLDAINRFEVIKTLYRYNNMPGSISTVKTTQDVTNYQSKVKTIGFTDLGGSSYKNDLDGIVWAYNTGIISKDTTFKPTGDCTRAQFVTMLYRMAGQPSVSGTIPFSDVKTTDWFYNAVLWGYNVGLVKGSTNGTFMPNNALKRQELAIFLYRYDTSVKGTYSIVYNLMGGSATNKTSYSKSALPYTLKNPTKSGYTFLGWTGSNGTTASKSVTIKSGTTGDLAYTANWKQNEVTLTKIAIKTKPSKLTYNGGETLDTTGLVLTATYSDGSTRNITSGFIATPTSFNAPGTKTITVSYGGKTTSYTVTVNSVNVNTTLTKITIKTKPTKLVYNVGETLDTTGLVLTATYSDGTVKDITSGYTVNPTTLNAAGAKTITVSYGGKTTTYTVTVNSVTLNKIAIKTKPTKLVYNVGDKVDTSGLVLTATYSDGTVKDISSDYTVNPTTLKTAGAKTITVSYGGKTTSYTVTVNEIKVEKIEIVKLPQQIEYYVGDNFKSDGLTISIYNSNGSVETITSGYQLSIAEGSKLSSPGTIKVSVSYKSKTATFNINVLNKNEDSIIMSSMPNKTNYLVGEKFDATGLELQLVNNNGVTPIKDGYTLSLADGSVLNKVGTHKVVVTYQTKKFEFNIVVKKVSKIEVDTSTVDTEYEVGEKFNEDISVTVEYSDGTKEEIKDNFIVSDTEFTSTGANPINISYGGVDTSIVVNVIESNDKEPTQNEYQPTPEEPEEKENASGMKFNTFHIILLALIAVGITVVFEYKRNN